MLKETYHWAQTEPAKSTKHTVFRIFIFWHSPPSSVSEGHVVGPSTSVCQVSYRNIFVCIYYYLCYPAIGRDVA